MKKSLILVILIFLSCSLKVTNKQYIGKISSIEYKPSQSWGARHKMIIYVDNSVFIISDLCPRYVKLKSKLYIYTINGYQYFSWELADILYPLKGYNLNIIYKCNIES